MPCKRASLSVTSGNLVQQLVELQERAFVLRRHGHVRWWRWSRRGTAGSDRSAPSTRIPAVGWLWRSRRHRQGASPANIEDAHAAGPTNRRPALQLLEQPVNSAGSTLLAASARCNMAATSSSIGGRQARRTNRLLKRFRPTASAGRNRLRTRDDQLAPNEHELGTDRTDSLCLSSSGCCPPQAPRSCGAWMQNSTTLGLGADQLFELTGGAAARWLPARPARHPRCASSCASCSPVSDCSRELWPILSNRSTTLDTMRSSSPQIVVGTTAASCSSGCNKPRTTPRPGSRTLHRKINAPDTVTT